MSTSRMPMDRRNFMVSVAVSSAGSAVGALLPASLLQAGEVSVAVVAPTYPDPCGDWTLDDMCSAYPPYSFDIRRSPTPHAAVTAQVAAADQMWVA